MPWKRGDVGARGPLSDLWLLLSIQGEMVVF